MPLYCETHNWSATERDVFWPTGDADDVLAQCPKCRRDKDSRKASMRLSRRRMVSAAARGDERAMLAAGADYRLARGMKGKRDGRRIIPKVRPDYEWFERNYGIAVGTGTKGAFQGKPFKVIGQSGPHLIARMEHEDAILHPTWAIEWPPEVLTERDTVKEVES